MNPRVAVVTDSGASLPRALLERWGIIVVPLEVMVDGALDTDPADRHTDRVLEALEEGSKVSTSQPSRGAFDDAYRAAAEAGADGVVAVHLSGELSGTVNGARLAAAASPVPVTVVDSRSVGMGTGWAALAAAAKVRAGASADEAAAEATRVAASSSMMLTVDSLEYLRRGGRVPAAVAAIGDALGVRPVLGVEDGTVVILERVRTTPRARDAVVKRAEEAMAELSNPGLAIMGLGAQEYVEDVAIALGERHPRIAMVIRTAVSSVLAVHGGPGSFAIAVADLPAELE